MRQKRLLWISALTLLFVPITQSTEAQVKSDGLDSSRVVKKLKHEPELTEYELMWKAIETHGKVEFQIGGKEINLKKRFDAGEEPYFNAFEEGLKPGVYTYQIKFIPNQIQNDRDNFQDVVNQRKKLLKLRDKKMRLGEREEAKNLLQQANELRKTAEQQRMDIQKDNQYDFITKSGSLIVDKNGSIKKFDIKKMLEEAAKRDRENNRLKALEHEDEENGINT